MSPSPVGQCGEEFWIADALWQLAKSGQRQQFTDAVCLLIVISAKARSRPRAVRLFDAGAATPPERRDK